MNTCDKCRRQKPVSLLFRMVVAGGECKHEVCDLCLYTHGHKLFMEVVKYHCDKKAGKLVEYPQTRSCPIDGCDGDWEQFLCNSINVPLKDDRYGYAWDGYILRNVPAPFIELPICQYATELDSLKQVTTRPLSLQLKWVHRKWCR